MTMSRSKLVFNIIVSCRARCCIVQELYIIDIIITVFDTFSLISIIAQTY